MGRNPSKRLTNSVISVNTGLWGGMHNFICPTDGTTVAGQYLELLKAQSPDCIVLCGIFANRQDIIRQLEQHSIHACFLYKRIALDSVERFGIGIEGIFDSKFLQSLRYGTFPYAAIIDPRLTSATLFDRVSFGIPPNRLKKHIGERADFITLTRYRRESQREESDFDEIISMIKMTGENLKVYRTVQGRRLTLPRYGLGRLYFVVGDENSLEDACYFWNLRAIFGPDLVRWLPLNDFPSCLNRQEVAYARIPTLTSASDDLLPEIKNTVKESGIAQGNIRYSQAKAILRLMANSVWQSELKREHMVTSEGEFVFQVSRPSSFELVYPLTYPRWVVDLRVIRDDTIGTEGFVLPNLSYLPDMMTPGHGSRVRPRMRGDMLSLQVTSARIDEYVRLIIPGDWEVIRATFEESGYRICLSDQGNYMSHALALFGGLTRLASLLRDGRAIAIFDQFVKHHRSKKRIAADDRYRRALTLEDMSRVVMSFTGSKSRKNREKDFKFIDEFLRDLIRVGATTPDMS